MRRNTSILIFIAALVLILTPACALGNLVARDEPPPATPTRTPKPTFTPTPPETPTPAIAPTNTATPEPTATETPVETPTPEVPPTDTPEPTPEVARLVINNPTLNVRGGPGTNYAVVGRANNGERYDVTGKNSQGSWYQIDFNGQNGWVAGEYVALEGDPGSVQVAANIPAAPVQPTRPPAPTAAPVPTSPPAPTQPPAPTTPYFLLAGAERCDPNPGSTYFNGFVRARDNAPLNGVCVHVAYYGPRNTKCSGCDGVGNGVWGFSPFGGPAPAGTTVEIYVVQCPGEMPPGGQSESTGFGDLTPQSDKWVHTVQASEQCTGITFVRN